MLFKPWNKDIEQMFMRISRNGKAYVDGDFGNTTKLISRDEKLLNYIELYYNRKKHKTVVLPMDDVFVVPKPISVNSKRRLFEIYRLF